MLCIVLVCTYFLQLKRGPGPQFGWCCFGSSVVLRLHKIYRNEELSFQWKSGEILCAVQEVYCMILLPKLTFATYFHSLYILFLWPLQRGGVGFLLVWRGVDEGVFRSLLSWRTHENLSLSESLRGTLFERFIFSNGHLINSHRFTHQTKVTGHNYVTVISINYRCFVQQNKRSPVIFGHYYPY